MKFKKIEWTFVFQKNNTTEYYNLKIRRRQLRTTTTTKKILFIFLIFNPISEHTTKNKKSLQKFFVNCHLIQFKHCNEIKKKKFRKLHSS